MPRGYPRKRIFSAKLWRHSPGKKDIGTVSMREMRTMVQRRNACGRLRIREYFCSAGPKVARLFPTRPEEDTQFLKRLYKYKLKYIAPNYSAERLPITAGSITSFSEAHIGIVEARKVRLSRVMHTHNAKGIELPIFRPAITY